MTEYDRVRLYYIEICTRKATKSVNLTSQAFWFLLISPSIEEVWIKLKIE